MRHHTNPFAIDRFVSRAIKVAFLLGLVPSLLGAQADEAKPTSHTTRTVEGWTVHVDDRLLQGPDAEIGQQALLLLADWGSMAQRHHEIQKLLPGVQRRGRGCGLRG